MAFFRLLLILCIITFSSMSLSSCQKEYKKKHFHKKKNTLFQVSTIDALLSGVYDSNFSLHKLKKHGDFGLGTFNKLDGELIMLDGKIFQVTAEGKVKKPEKDITTPMAVTNYFYSDYEIEVKQNVIKDFNELQSLVKEQINFRNKNNYFHAIKVHGRFNKIKARSVPKQEKPYIPLKEIIKDQAIFDFENISGTLVGYWNPDFIKGINVPGFHFHFIADDRSSGGHVFSFSDLTEFKIEIDRLNKFKIFLPNDKDFQNANLTKDRTDALEKVEKKRINNG